MRILHIETVNRVASTYASALDRRGHVSTIYEPSLRGGGGPLPLKLAMMPARVLDLRPLVRMLNRDYCDVVHIHWASYGILGFVSQVPVVLQCHGSDVRERLRTPLYRAALAPVLRSAGAVLCVTPDILPVVRTLRPDAAFFPAAVDTVRFAPAHGAHARPWTILLLARLDPAKGADVAMGGIQAFGERHREVRVLVLDWGPLKRVYRDRFGARFDFIPRVAPEAVPHLIQQADVIIGQFGVGALGLSELQAMSCAKPVIASFRYPNAYSTPPPLANASTADAVEAELEQFYRRREEGTALGLRARKWILENYDCDLLAARLEYLYRHIIEGASMADAAP